MIHLIEQGGRHDLMLIKAVELCAQLGRVARDVDNLVKLLRQRQRRIVESCSVQRACARVRACMFSALVSAHVSACSVHCVRSWCLCVRARAYVVRALMLCVRVFVSVCLSVLCVSAPARGVVTRIV